MTMFAPATKEQTRLRLALMGPSGSGKSYTALRFAHLLADGGKIAVVDTENRSASKYVGESPDGARWAFDVANMEAPYTPKSFVEAIHGAERAGYAVLVIDSMTHMWSGRGGLLDMVDQRASASSSKNSFDAWRACKPHEREFWDAVTACKIHLIVTFRTKTEWVIQENDRGKKVPTKIGTKAEQRDGVEYEFDVALMLDEDNRASPAKTRCPSLTGLSWSKPGREVVDPLKAWLSDGAPPAPTPAPAPFVATKPADTKPAERSIDELRTAAVDALTSRGILPLFLQHTPRAASEWSRADITNAGGAVRRFDARTPTEQAFDKRLSLTLARIHAAGIPVEEVEQTRGPFGQWSHDDMTKITDSLPAADAPADAGEVSA